jgi:ketosteroid isomerase-like protein
MTELNELLELEKGFWTGGPEFYRAHADARCLVAFGDMASALALDDLVATVKSGPRWQDPDLKVKGFIEPTEGMALLTYEAHAKRKDGSKSYAAVVTSGYVRRSDGWKLAFHQQTPLTS